ncbi:formate dehydrogenase [Gordoniibacillus kamchatkensis]|uniref:Sulfur carrier protein FdhD n=1 Tax=Gordoniibacillus kamchatkensis TaxID=1590651 RepID=A0ABR5ADU5_9BACL|nr:formate dehydrogenase accessory sulfurtransferase FdhD [Paenibacillus sp. VKM B-2647]KIL39110.1 formate dehydrogenase [Paenibacillus sp. VKM B-2647]
MAGRKLSTTWNAVRYEDGGWKEREEEVASEYPLTVRLDGEEFATIVCTPADLDEMVIGFLASEGVILTADDVTGLSIDDERGMADVELKRKHTASAEFYGKRFIGSCCGKGRQFYLQNDVRTARTSTSRLRVSAERCLELMRRLQAESAAYRHTGGVHNAALCSPEGIVVTRSDIGRHNALDKIYGYCLLHRIPTRDGIVAFSGRLSSEVVLKTAKIGAAVLLSNAAPTDLGLKLAAELGLTVAGFARDAQMNVYTHRERITTA